MGIVCGVDLEIQWRITRRAGRCEGMKDITMNKDKCRGLIYRASVSHFINKKMAIVHKIQLNPVKKMSCSGCDECSGLIFSFDCIGLWWPVYLDVEDKKLYRLDTCNHSVHWETGERNCNFHMVEVDKKGSFYKPMKLPAAELPGI